MSEHLSEDRLLELAYGELSPQETAAAEAHAQGCEQCARPLREIRSVRRVMAELPALHPPASAASSLLAYAEQTAGRRRARRGSGWRRWFAPLTTVLAFSLVAVVGVHVVRDTRPSEALERRRQEPEMRAPVELAAPPPSFGVVTGEQKTSRAESVSGKGFARPPPAPPAAAKSKVARSSEPEAAKPMDAAERQLQDEGSSGTMGAFKKRERYAVAPSAKQAPSPAADLSKDLSGGEEQSPTLPPAGSVAANGVTGENKRLHASREDVAPSVEKDSQSAAPQARRMDRLSSLDTAPPQASAPATGRAVMDDRSVAPADKGAKVAKTEGDSFRDERALSREKSPGSPPVSLDELPGVLARARGAAREPLLHRLCDEEHRPEHEAAARAACRSLIEEFPRSIWMPTARARLQSSP